MGRKLFHFLLLVICGLNDARALDNKFGIDLSTRVRKFWSANTSSDFSFGSRFLDGGIHSDRLFMEASIARNHERFRFSVGYFVQIYQRNQAGQEHRPWQQADYRIPCQHSYLDIYARLEERYFEQTGKVVLRTRTAVVWYKELNARTKFDFGDEIVTNLNSQDGEIHSGFNQNRVLAGIAYRYSKAGSIQINYQFRFVHSPVKEDYYFHLMQIQLQLQF